LAGRFHVSLDDGTSAERGLVMPANLERRIGSALIAPTHGDAALMIPMLIGGERQLLFAEFFR
jgi:hypothetical protein